MKTCKKKTAVKTERTQLPFIEMWKTQGEKVLEGACQEFGNIR